MPILSNKQAFHNYSISEKYEAGLILSGPEVKSVKKGQVDLKGAYISIDPENQAWIKNCYIAPYKPAKQIQKDYQPNRNRKLLLTKKEIRRFLGKQQEKGTSIIPLAIFIKNRLIKLEIGVGRGKKKYDKREDMKKKDFERKKQNLFKHSTL